MKLHHRGVGKLAELVFVDAHESFHLEALTAGQGGIGGHFLEHIEIDKTLAEQSRAALFVVEALQEIDDPLEGFGGLAFVVEEAFAIDVIEAFPCGIDEDARGIAAFDEGGEKRKAPEKCRQVARRPLAVLQPQVFVGSQAQQRHRRNHGLAARQTLAGVHEDDGVFDRRLRDFGGSEEHRMHVLRDGKVRRAPEPLVAMQHRVEHLRVAIKGRIDQLVLQRKWWAPDQRSSRCSSVTTA